MIGRVVSTKMQKTAAVLIEGKKTHPLYKKTYVWSKKYLVHDEMGAKLGDVVSIAPTRPISKRKHFKIIKILGKDEVALGEAAMKRVEEEAIAEVMPEEKEEKPSALSDQLSAETEASKKAKDKEPTGPSEGGKVEKEKKVESKGKEKSESRKLKTESE
ncbi:30S ribosomal protein S17 [Candidatus Daviesbacteria bacterium]|nr:30S ribosomal protein S17 [Candidatus Daviesbacteria bacterium]